MDGAVIVGQGLLRIRLDGLLELRVKNIGMFGVILCRHGRIDFFDLDGNDAR